MATSQPAGLVVDATAPVDSTEAGQHVIKPDGVDRRARNAMLGAWFGFFVDLFDIYLPIVVLGPALAYFVSPRLVAASASNTTLIGGSIFAATLLGRPVGAFLFGRIADTVGRKRAAVLSMRGAGVATLLMTLMPGYAQIGTACIVLFLILRLIGGIFLGGEYTGANPLAMEAAPRHKRGLYSGLINTSFPLAYATISLLTLLLLLVMPSATVGSAYVQWGWRIPFAIASVLAFALARYFQRTVHESRIFNPQAATRTPIKTLFTGANGRCFVQVFVLMSGFWLSLEPVAASLPALLGKGVGLSARQGTLTLVVAYLLVAVGNVSLAVLSQRVGRRRLLRACGVAMGIGATATYLILVQDGPGHTSVAVGAAILTVVLATSPWAILPAYINERFPTAIRASGYGLAYSTAVIIPSFFAFYQQWLSHLMAFGYTGIVLVLAGAALIFIGAHAGPETKDLEFERMSAPVEAGT